MTKEEIFQFMNENPVFYLASMDGDQPRVRGMLLFRANEDGIIFHTSAQKDVYAQIRNNPKAELCFFGNGMQIRVTGELEYVQDDELKEEIYNHPSRKFLQVWRENGISDDILRIFNLRKATAVIWTMETNFAEKVPISLF